MKWFGGSFCLPECLLHSICAIQIIALECIEVQKVEVGVGWLLEPAVEALSNLCPICRIQLTLLSQDMERAKEKKEVTSPNRHGTMVVVDWKSTVTRLTQLRGFQLQ